MARIHYNTRTGARRTGGRMYRGVGAVKPLRARPEPTPATPGQHTCPRCGGGADAVFAIYSDTEAGIKRGVTRVLGRHSDGRGKCIASGTVPVL